MLPIRALALASVVLCIALTTRGTSASPSVATATTAPLPSIGAAPPASSTLLPPSSAPDVVLVVIDDMSWEEFFHVATPNMIGLALKGQVCTNCYVHPVCSPTRIGLNFGIYSVREGVVGALDHTDADNAVPPERLALAQVLQAEGYATALFGKWHVNTAGDGRPNEGARRFGFEHWFAGAAGNIGKEGSASQTSWRPIEDGHDGLVTHYSGDLITQEFEDWWSQPSARPRFASINYTTPHEPWTTPPAAFLPAGYTVAGNKRSRYEASIAALDGFLGRVCAAVDLSTTYVIVLPDNGTPHNVTPPSNWYQGYKLTPWQGGVHVPLLVAGPGITPGFNPRLIHAIDVPETVLELCGLAAPFGFEDGESFAPSLFGVMPPRSPVVMQFKKFDPATTTLVKDDWSVVDANGMKLVSEAGVERLYRLTSDPFETTPLWLPQVHQALKSVKEAIDP